MGSISIEQFRCGMRQLAAGVCIVTTEHQGTLGGLTATSVTSLSAEPPRLVVSINRKGTTHGLLTASRKLCVNILAREQVDLARRFATSMPPEGDDRFAGNLWTPMETGAPALTGALTNFDCYVSSILDTGSHGIVVADIVSARHEAGLLPLLYADGKFLTLGAAVEG